MSRTIARPMSATATSSDALDQLCVNTLRFLSVDAVQKANSGHPGMPLGAAAMAYVLWTRFLKHSPRHPHWFDRDRFVLSAGHGSMLLYSLLHVTGYDLSLDDIKRFRQWGSKTPGHPERGHTPGVEATTGPLGQGFANAVGMAIAEAQLAARYNRPGFEVIDHTTYAIVSDGDLMEGVSAEAASLAGHLRLGKLICLYDDNKVTLAAGTDITFSEDRVRRFAAYGWHTESVADGNDLASIDSALRSASAEASRPSLIRVCTHIGYGSPHKHDSFEAHGSPLGVDEVRLTKENLGWPAQPTFLIPEDALVHFREAVARGTSAEAACKARMAAYARAFPDLAEELRRSLSGELPPGWDADIPIFPASAAGMATRVASGKVMNAIAPRLPALTGGSADLDPSTRTALKGLGDFNSPASGDVDKQGSDSAGWSFSGRNLHFGVREHAHGGDHQWHGGARRCSAVQLDLFDFLRLHAPSDAIGRADGAPRRARVHSRQYRARRGRAHPSAGRTVGGIARDSEFDRYPSSRRERDCGRLAGRAGNTRSAYRVGAHAPGRPDARSRSVRIRRGLASRRVRACRLAGRRARARLSRERL